MDIYFEEQNIHTLSAAGELMLTILASYAQEESLSASENQKWRIQKNFSEGKPWNGVMLGYRQENGKYIVVPEEAKIVRRIYTEYLSGHGIDKIVNCLNADGILTQKGYAWRKCGVTRILRNQRFYSENHLTKRKLENDGELPRYVAKNTHEAIITEEQFSAVQAEIERRAAMYRSEKSSTVTYPFTRLITCGICGKHYRRKTTPTGVVWICSTYNSQGKAACPSKQIPENKLTEITSDLDISNISQITAENNNRLTFVFKDGTTEIRRWKDRSRAESWTDEMKSNAAKQTKERWQKCPK